MDRTTLIRFGKSKRLWVIVLLLSFDSGTVQAYIDPGTTGLLSQVLYVMFYAALGIFLYGIRYIKGFMLSLNRTMLRLFGRNKSQGSSRPDGTV